ncbi:MAG: hypothetical protein U1E76_23965 [Planctomycetota bacterium]
MPKILKAKLREFLHDYRLSCYKLAHDPVAVQTLEKDAKVLVDQILAQNFHYHPHRQVDANRAEMMNVVHWYVTESILPPVLSKLANRIALLQKRQELAMEMFQNMLNYLSEEEQEASAGR